jgi:hypothetical protein
MTEFTTSFFSMDFSFDISFGTNDLPLEPEVRPAMTTQSRIRK